MNAVDDQAWDRAPVALLRLRSDGTVVAANRALLDWVGCAREEVVGHRRLSELLTVGGRIYWETHLSPLLHMHGRVDEVAIELRGPERALPVLLSAVVDATGGPRFVDVALSTARERSRYERELVAARAAAERARDQVRALQRTTAALSQAPTADAVCAALLDAARHQLGASGARLWTPAPSGELAARTGSTAPPADAAEVPTWESLREGPSVTSDGTAVVPLVGSTGVQGALCLDARTDPSAEPWELGVLAAIGQQAGLALERALLHDRSATVAHELQQALLTTHLPSDPRIAVTTAYRPGVEALEVGGDWYDAFLPEDGVLAVAVGDVVGRGLHAATAMGQLRNAVRAIAGPGVGPARLLTRLDRYVLGVEGAFMATMVYAEIDLVTGVVTYAAAGHLPPLRVSAEGRSGYLWEGRSTPLGVEVAGRARGEGRVALRPHDTLLLCTDGLVERRDRPLDSGLEVLARIAPDILREDRAGAAERLMTEPLLQQGRGRDDVCVLVASWSGQEPGGVPAVRT